MTNDDDGINSSPVYSCVLYCINFLVSTVDMLVLRYKHSYSRDKRSLYKVDSRRNQ
jgi:hypothetical protein